MINTADMLKIFQRYRGDAIVVPGHGGRHWINISTKPNLDAIIGGGHPGMGGQASFALGLALAQPNRKVVLFDSEGDLLMGFGVLATIADRQPKNFYHFLLDNECYGLTGGQPVPNGKNMRYDVIARGTGYPSTYNFVDIEDFSSNIERIMAQPGPVFVAMKVIPEINNLPIDKRIPWQTRRPIDVLKDLRKELGVAR